MFSSRENGGQAICMAVEVKVNVDGLDAAGAFFENDVVRL